MPLSMIVTGRRQFTLGMSRNNFDQCVFYIVVFPEKRLLQFNLFPPHVCLRTCGSSLIFIQIIWTSYPIDLFDCRTKIFIDNFIAVIYLVFFIFTMSSSQLPISMDLSGQSVQSHIAAFNRQFVGSSAGDSRRLNPYLCPQP